MNGHVEEMQLNGMSLPNTCKALGSTPSAEKKKIKMNEWKKGKEKRERARDGERTFFL